MTDDYQTNLRHEREYVADLYTRLDAERARAKARFDAALRTHEGTAVDREVETHSFAREQRRLSVSDNGLCFGRLDPVSGAAAYIGRTGLFDDDREYLIDWRAPAARAFYTATGAHPEGMARRRQFLTRGRDVVSFDDEVFGRPGDGEHGDAALLAAVNAPRGDGMRDIVATIQAEQDAIIRLDDAGVLVVEGGPGTGKTAVALHRVAYLLYTQRDAMSRHGVLVVGPNPGFLNHISRVLPSLGETDAVFTTTGDLVPGLHVTSVDEPDLQRHKGSLRMLDVLAGAVADRQRVPDEAIEVRLGGITGRVSADVAGWARDEARASGLPHNTARAIFVDVLTFALTERAIGRIGSGWLSRDEKTAWEEMRASLTTELMGSEEFTEVIDALWPVLTPGTLLSQLYSSHRRLQAAGAPSLLYRAEGDAWTVSDVPLLDELTDLLGPDPAVELARARSERDQAAQESEYAEGVLNSLVGRADHMDDDDHLFATDLLYAEDLAGHFEERDTRGLAERAAADRDWTYRHIVVDEAQELSEMDWRVLMRRCPGHSFTVVGDLAQRRSAAGARSWSAMLDRYVPGRWQYRPLTVNYRTPAEIMAVAGRVLAGFAPDVAPPESVRSSGMPPWTRRVDESGLGPAIREFVAYESDREGTAVAIGPVGVAGTIPPSGTKGLEFDAVLVVEPARILTEEGPADLYVALTRATQRLGILHSEPLPDTLAGLADAPAETAPAETAARA
ncbi:RNA polymerase recycling motor ATPase HelR [Tsukamurella sp. 8F]|uniref:RNA polymerase recycling motor ATPase HelR n=1 Tax=unclassified Tsukamurella TaxID=2633480 RepID=UPI0023B89A7C|nr:MULTISPECIES: RNA polymerase recycling motor ATPase HelR [unclassified Tsukamurella]MDF0531541.1 RNA polymerase recycling motor ATPase HelR [Tsukamurella sp. 8J]MDF0588847.1 RNA polymerase recycling motor ATPase HelR [Tsukamurella sp. 8F]